MGSTMRRNGLTHALVNFSQSETTSLISGGRGKILALTGVCVCVWGGGCGVNRKHLPYQFQSATMIEPNISADERFRFPLLAIK